MCIALFLLLFFNLVEIQGSRNAIEHRIAQISDQNAMASQKCNCTGLPCRCFCNNETIIVDCSNKQMVEIPNDVPYETIFLNMSHNNLQKLKSDSLEGLPLLRTLDLSHNDLRDVTHGCLGNLTSLEVLNITMNLNMKIENFRDITYGLETTKIKEIRASYIVDQRWYPSVVLSKDDLLGISQTNLKTLSVDADQIQISDASVLGHLPKSLEFLSAKGNLLAFIALDGLFQFSMFYPYLHTIDISYQCIGHTMFGEMQHLYVLSRLETKEALVDGVLNENLVLKTTTKQHIPNNYGDCRGDDFNASAIHSKLKKVTARKMANVNCITKWEMGRFDLEYVDLSSNGFEICRGPVTLAEPQHLKHMDLSENNCRYVTDNFMSNITSIEYLLLGGNFLGPVLKNTGSTMFRVLKQLKTLDLSRKNYLENIPNDLLIFQVNIITLNLSRNSMSSLTLHIGHMTNLQDLDVSYNEIMFLPEQTTQNLDRHAQQRNVSVNLQGNPLVCSCKELAFWKWLAKTKVQVQITNTSKCLLDNSSYVPFSSLRQLTNLLAYEKMCTKNYTLYIVVPFSLLFILVVISIVIYRKRWQITYRWYIYRLRKRGYTPLRGHDNGHGYDAFVSYCEENGDFVKNVMLRKLETESGLRLCMHERDFIPGHPIASNICAAIHNSSKTLIVLSRDFLNSHWCRYELNMATEEEHHSGRKVVILVVVEKMERKELPVEALEHYSKNTYLELPIQEDCMETFWHALIQTISN